MAFRAPARSTLVRPAAFGLAMALAATAAPASAADVFHSERLGALLLEGQIEATDPERMDALYDAAAVKPDKLYLSSPGGDFLAAIAAGEWVRLRQIDTYAAGVLCHSACGYLWLGGQRRFANGVVTLHMPYYHTLGTAIAIPDEGIMEASWYLARLGYDKSLIEALLVVSTTEANQAFPITGPNTALFGITYENFEGESGFRDELRALRAEAGAAAGRD